MRLITLSEYVLQRNEFGLHKKSANLIRAYAEFLQQELKLEMFLPCKNGQLLKGKPLSPAKDSEWIRWENESEDYLKSKELLLFKNVHFDTVDSQKVARFYKVGNTQVFNLSDDGTHLYWHHYTIESLLSEFDEDIYIEAEF